MSVLKCSFCGVFGDMDHHPYGDTYPFVCDCNRGTWEPAQTEVINNTIADYV